MTNATEKEQQGNSIGELKKYFTEEGQPLSIHEFKAEWDQLSEEEKAWFKQQSLREG